MDVIGTVVPIECARPVDFDAALEEQDRRDKTTATWARGVKELGREEALFVQTLDSWGLRESIARAREYEAKALRCRAMAQSPGKNAESREADAMEDERVERAAILADRARVNADESYQLMLYLRARAGRRSEP